MKMTKANIIAVALASLALAACSNTVQPANQAHSHEHGHTHEHGHSHAHEHSHSHDDDSVNRNAKFECRNGMTVTLKQANVDNIQISINSDTQTAQLQRVQAASGALYASDSGLYGKRTEWHEKGGSAVFQFADAYGNVTETSCQAK